MANATDTPAAKASTAAAAYQRQSDRRLGDAGAAALDAPAVCDSAAGSDRSASLADPNVGPVTRSAWRVSGRSTTAGSGAPAGRLARVESPSRSSWCSRVTSSSDHGLAG